MMSATFNIRKPKDDSCEFYKTFYRCYSLMQINDIIMNELLSEVSEKQCNKFVDSIIKDGLDMERASVYTIGMGIYDGSLEKRKKDDRGLDTSVFKELKISNVNPLQWYLEINEFMQLYALCEQGCKEFLDENGFDVSAVREKKLIHTVFDIIQKKDKKNIFVKSIADNTNLILNKQNTVKFVWLYYTEIRNSLMHANGRITDRFKESMEDFLSKWTNELNSILEESSMVMNCMMHDIDDDFFTVPDSGFINLGRLHLNFFRSFIIILLEALDDIK